MAEMIYNGNPLTQSVSGHQDHSQRSLSQGNQKHMDNGAQVHLCVKQGQREQTPQLKLYNQWNLRTLSGQDYQKYCC